jgi:uncharacterized protein YbjT (DUF2867 family)
MNIVLFGATGMVGQGVLRECLLAPDVNHVLSIVRTPSGQKHTKLREIVVTDFYDLSLIESDLSGYDACFFTLGVTSAGMAEQQYSRVTYDLTLTAAKALAKLNPGMIFIYVSGAGTDSTESGRVMWARIKGKTENAILRLPFKAAYMFRPGIIQPLHGITSKTRSYRIFYAIAAPLFPILKAIFPRHIATTEEIGRALLNVARHGFSKPILEASDIIQAA